MIGIDDILSFLEAEGLEHEYSGDAGLAITGYCALSEPKPGCVTWIKQMEKCELSSIDASLNMLIVTNKKPVQDCSGYNLIITNQPKTVFFEILNNYFLVRPEPVIAPTATVETSDIGENVSIGHNCYICADVSIGDNVVIRNNVVIESPAKIGNDCVIGSGTIIGSHGGGFYRKDGKRKKAPDFGGVTIGNRVEIGANACISRGTLADTVIEDDVKISNLCVVGHNVFIGEGSYIVSQRIAGSTRIGRDVFVALGAIIKNQLTIGDDSYVSMGSVVNKNIAPNQLVAGNPAKVVKGGLHAMQVLKKRV